MDVIKSILFQLLDSDTSLGNIPSLSECHNEDLDQSLYGICFSSKEGSISYANKAFMQSMESISFMPVMSSIFLQDGSCRKKNVMTAISSWKMESV